MDLKSFSLNGRDGSGKSTQIMLLGLDCLDVLHPTRPLITYSERWKKAAGIEMSKWWFEEVRPEDLTDIIIESLNRRHLDTQDGKIQMHDRGWRMFKAVCVATWVTRDKSIGFPKAIAAVDELFSRKLDHEPREIEIFLKPDPEYFLSIKKILAFSQKSGAVAFPRKIEDRYAVYQGNLREAMTAYFSPSEAISVDVDMPICDIQNKIRRIISQKSGVDLFPLADNLRVMIGFSGLSESGKSSFAEHLRKEKAFARLKLRYFIELIEKRGQERTDEGLVLELLLYLRRHYYVDLVTLESLHDPHVPAILKLMFGDRFKVVYLSAEREVRERRVLSQLGKDTVDLVKISSEILYKDEVKRARGVSRIPDISDIIIDNNSDDFEGNISRLLLNLGLS